MLRLGLIAIQMLPENCQSSVTIITDGVLGAANVHALQALLAQLRSYTVAVSFIQVVYD
jgi:virulence-associated protein VapD